METVERRRAERFPMRMEGHFWTEGECSQEKVGAAVIDLSALGAYLESDLRPEPESEILLCLSWPNYPNGATRIVRASGRALRVELLSGSFGVAVGFVSALHFAERCRNGSSESAKELQVPALFAPPQLNWEAFEYYGRLKKILAFVRKHGFQNISLVRCAKLAAMERSYFSVFFSEKVGITFRDWIRELRISEARKLMAQHNYPISDVAAMVGYRDLRSFERAFKKSTDLRPRDFKKLVSP